MTGKASRDKGARGERELAEILSHELGVVVKRKLGQARDGGDDIQVGKFRIEVKRREKLSIDSWCEQVEKASEPGDVPVLVYRRNGQPWRVVVGLQWFIKAMREELSDAERGAEKDSSQGGGDHGTEVVQ
jgi:Holliday junction resolvase